MTSETKKPGMIVPVVQYRGPPLQRPEKANPAVPDHIWDQFQDLGELAVGHMKRLLTDPRFPHLAIKDQTRVMDMALSRAYGSPDGSVRRNLHVHTDDPDSVKGFNVMQELSATAKKTLPEFRSPTRRDLSGVSDAQIVASDDTDSE